MRIMVHVMCVVESTISSSVYLFQSNTTMLISFLLYYLLATIPTNKHHIHFFSANNFFTAFLSSSKNALMIRVLTHPAHTAPPYALLTVLSLFLLLANCAGVILLIPIIRHLQSAHLGALLFLEITWDTRRPPGVLTGTERRDLVA